MPVSLRGRHQLLASCALVALVSFPPSYSAARTVWSLLRVGSPLATGSMTGSNVTFTTDAFLSSMPTPAYFRPVIDHGKAFPLARSNYLSLIQFPNSWHAPRLRLVNGKWLLIGIHEGIDIFAERGTPIISMEAGHVENVGWTFYSGTRVGVRGVDGRYYFYAHLSAIDPHIRVGTSVAAGTVLGKVGNTGYGPPGHRNEFPWHLHFGIEVGSEWVDPYSTLVSLYAVAVRTTARSQAILDQLADEGRRSQWDLMAAQTFMSS